MAECAVTPVCYQTGPHEVTEQDVMVGLIACGFPRHPSWTLANVAHVIHKRGRFDSTDPDPRQFIGALNACLHQPSPDNEPIYPHGVSCHVKGADGEDADDVGPREGFKAPRSPPTYQPVVEEHPMQSDAVPPPRFQMTMDSFARSKRAPVRPKAHFPSRFSDDGMEIY